ncbi:MAG: hypothetical protein GXO23_07605 [Crenarchaeota archaeon]|nr:hypothetical protein [Thermoproteota archaeon]
MVYSRKYLEFLKEVENVSNTDLLFISLILAMHKLSAPETLLAIFREASCIFIEYLKQNRIIKLENLQDSIEGLCRSLSERFRIVNNIVYKMENNKLYLEVSNCMFRNICRYIDKVVGRRPELLEILESRPCGINILFSTLITFFDKIPEVEEVVCKNGNATITMKIT